MQYSTGTCTVTNGSPVVVGDADVDWSDALTAITYGQPVLFSLLESTAVCRPVSAVESSATSGSGFWELTLASEWTDITQAEVEYMIHASFTLNFGLALAAAGERQWGQLFSRNMEIIDANLSGAGSGLDADLTTVLSSGKTLIASNVLYIPEGATLNIQEGASVVIL